MSNRSFSFTHAITRRPSLSVVSGLSSTERGVPDFELMKDHHLDYVNALNQAGAEVIELDPLEDFPDSVFVEQDERVARRVYNGINSHQMFFLSFVVRNTLLQLGPGFEALQQLFVNFGSKGLEMRLQNPDVVKMMQSVHGPVQRTIGGAAMDGIDSYALELLLMAALNAAKPIDAIIVSSSEERLLVKGELVLDDVHLDTHSSLPEPPRLRALDQIAWQSFLARANDVDCFTSLGVLTFEFKNKAGGKGTAGTVEREFWYEDVSSEAKPESRFIVLHLHFEGTVAEYEREKRDGKRDAVNSALRKVTSLNVRHAVSAAYIHACASPKSFYQDSVCRRLFVAKEVGMLKFNPYRHGFPPKPAQRQRTDTWDLGMDTHQFHSGTLKGQLSQLAGAVSAASKACDFNEHFGLQAVRTRGVDDGGADAMLVTLKPLVKHLLQQAAKDGIMCDEQGTDSCLQLDDELFNGDGASSTPSPVGVH